MGSLGEVMPCAKLGTLVFLVRADLFGFGSRHTDEESSEVPAVSPNDHPNPSHGRQKGFGKNRISGNFLPTHAGLATAENGQVLTGKGPKGGVPGVRTRDPRHGPGGP